MGGILKDFALIALIVFLNHWIYGVEDTISYDFLVNFITVNQTLFLVIGLFGSVTLLLFSTMFENLGLYKLTYGLSKLLVRICQFFITFLALVNIIYYAALHNNLMRDNGYLLLFCLALLLGASSWAIRIIDFNYHTRNAVLPPLLIAAVSIVIVEIIWPFYKF